jgi:hypothetical protein
MVNSVLYIPNKEEEYYKEDADEEEDEEEDGLQEYNDCRTPDYCIMCNKHCLQCNCYQCPDCTYYTCICDSSNIENPQQLSQTEQLAILAIFIGEYKNQWEQWLTNPYYLIICNKYMNCSVEEVYNLSHSIISTTVPGSSLEVLAGVITLFERNNLFSWGISPIDLATYMLRHQLWTLVDWESWFDEVSVEDWKNFSIDILMLFELRSLITPY